MLGVREAQKFVVVQPWASHRGVQVQHTDSQLFCHTLQAMPKKIEDIYYLSKVILDSCNNQLMVYMRYLALRKVTTSGCRREILKTACGGCGTTRETALLLQHVGQSF